MILPDFNEAKITVGSKEVTIKELSVRIIHKIEKKEIKDDVMTIVGECSDLKEEEIDNLGVSTARTIYEEIIKLTYGEENADDKKEESKKK